MMNAVEIAHLTFTYPGASQPTLRDISLQIQKGDFLAIVGNNGCGKSTLCKVLNGLIPHFIAGEFEGSVTVEGLNTLETDIGELAKKVGYVYQDFENQIVRPTTRSAAEKHWSSAGCRAARRNISGSFPAGRPICWRWPGRSRCSRTSSSSMSRSPSWTRCTPTASMRCCGS